jgi:hypothetical protein
MRPDHDATLEAEIARLDDVAQHLPARGVAEGVKDGIRLRRL